MTSLRNLVGASLETLAPSRRSIGRLLEGAARHIADAKVAAVSPETRFASAYTAIRMLADAGLHAHGYRTLTSRPGHHRTAIQTLSSTFDVEPRVIVRLDALRKQRNLAENSGDPVPESTVAECVSQAEALHAAATAWLVAHRPELL